MSTYLKRILLPTLPEKQGTYIVEVETNFLKQTKKFDAVFNGNSFDVNNQKVIAWYKEFEISTSELNKWENENKDYISHKIIDFRLKDGYEVRNYTLKDGRKIIIELPTF